MPSELAEWRKGTIYLLAPCVEAIPCRSSTRRIASLDELLDFA